MPTSLETEARTNPLENDEWRLHNGGSMIVVSATATNAEGQIVQVMYYPDGLQGTTRIFKRAEWENMVRTSRLVRRGGKDV